MSSFLEGIADAAVGTLSALGKRKVEDLDAEEPEPDFKDVPVTKAREVRLEQNRKAARESRRRKKVMIEELQRSVIFFSRANGALKQQNDELTRLLMQAQAQINSIENKTEEAPQQEHNNDKNVETVKAPEEKPTYAFHPAALRANGIQPLPPMQPGATMQAMANFQQAAAAAMQQAMCQMQNVPGVNMAQLAAQPIGANAQQAYTDTMTALAMQQAAHAAATGQHYHSQGTFMTPFGMYQHHQEEDKAQE